MKTYDLYCKDYLPCCFCNKLVSLYNANAHIKTKHCRALQQLLDEDDRVNLFIAHKREINKLKSELRLREED